MQDIFLLSLILARVFFFVPLIQVLLMMDILMFRVCFPFHQPKKFIRIKYFVTVQS